MAVGDFVSLCEMLYRKTQIIQILFEGFIIRHSSTKYASKFANSVDKPRILIYNYENLICHAMIGTNEYPI